jgi:hypothetical protein
MLEILYTPPPQLSNLVMETKLLFSLYLWWEQNFQCPSYVECVLQCIHQINLVFCCVGARGGIVVKALRYKPAGRGFNS